MLYPPHKEYRTENDIIDFFGGNPNSLAPFILQTRNIYIIKEFGKRFPDRLENLLKLVFEQEGNVDLEFLYILTLKNFIY